MNVDPNLAVSIYCGVSPDIKIALARQVGCTTSFKRWVQDHPDEALRILADYHHKTSTLSLEPLQ